ncbi:MAG: hypothetical protein DRN06_07885 [Thermoprotei archaeon]|nr:MAG: hypothetical protein DRN06_07885 [Thermoprotei archaeon]
MSASPPEYVINSRLAVILSRRLGIDCRAERVVRKKRPDIRCYYRGLIIGIEASYSRSDAERDAEKRLEEGLVDVALALWIKQRYPDVPEPELGKLIETSKFDVKIFVPREISETLLTFLEEKIGRKAEPATRWFKDIEIPFFKTLLDHVTEFLVREEEVKELIDEIKRKIRKFIDSCKNIDTRGILCKNLYNILWKLYGLSIAEGSDLSEIVFGQTALSILLSAAFYEHIRGSHLELKSIGGYIQRDPINGLKKALQDLLEIDYKVAVETTIKMLEVLPPQLALCVRALAELGAKVASNRALLKRDFAGRVYHEITGDIALRKGFATFYTEVPAAYLLANLATDLLFNLDEKCPSKLAREEAKSLLDSLKKVKVSDMACGSGTLLTASYYALHRLSTRLIYYHYLDRDVGEPERILDEIGRLLVEKGIYGIDALKYAAQITAINLALMSPGNISKENIYTIYLGYIEPKQQAWLGSLELLNDGRKVGGLLAWIEGGMEGVVERVTIEGTEGTFHIPSRFSLIIMNPPFTRATGRTGRKFAGKEKGLFGFIVDEKARKALVEAYDKVRKRIREELITLAKCNLDDSLKSMPTEVKELIEKKPKDLRQYLNIGQAGEGLLFLYLAYRYVEEDGVIAFVLPRGILAGISWFLARILLASKFHLKYVIVSSDVELGYNFSEGVSLSETLLIAKRVKEHRPDEETVFINLVRKPRTVLEAIMLAEDIKRSIRGNRMRAWIENSRGTVAVINKVKRSDLLKYIDNWNRFVSTTDLELLDIVCNLLNRGEITL